MFQTFISRHNSNFFSDKLVLTSVTPASSAPFLQTPKATSSTLYFDSLPVMLVMVVFFIAFRWIHLSTPLIRLFLLVLILFLMPTLNFLPVWFALSLLRFRLPSRLPMMFILFFFFQAEDGIRYYKVTGVQTCVFRSRFRQRHDRSQRRAQFVRHIRQKFLSHIFQPVQLRDVEQDANGAGGRLAVCRQWHHPQVKTF